MTGTDRGRALAHREVEADVASKACPMILDHMMPQFDATVVEHSVIEASTQTVYDTARDMDFMQIRSPMVDLMMSVRELPAKITRKSNADRPASTEPEMRLRDLFDMTTDSGGFGAWVGLGDDPGRELVFGAVAKVWQPDIEWKEVTAEAFRDFAEPDFAKIAVAFSMRSYGTDRTLLSYEARTVGTDAVSRAKFARYWWLVRRFVGVVMRAAVMSVKEQAEASSHTGN